MSASADCTIKRWNMSSGRCAYTRAFINRVCTGECTFTYVGHQGMVNRLLCTGDLIISSSNDTSARAWLLDIGPDEQRFPSMACVRVFRGHHKGVYALVFVPAEDEDTLPIGEDVQIKEDMLLTASADGTVRAWSMESAACLHVCACMCAHSRTQMFCGHVGPVQTMCVSPDGRQLFTGGADKTVRIWSVSTGEMTKVLEHHSDGVVAMVVCAHI